MDPEKKTKYIFVEAENKTYIIMGQWQRLGWGYGELSS